MGDSITRGNASQEPGRGTHRLFKEKTATRGNPVELQALVGRRYDVRNFGHGGRSVVETGPKENVAYARTQEYFAAEKFAPSIVVLMLGTNDAKYCSQPSTPKSPPSCKPGALGTVWNPRAFAPSLALLARTILAWPSHPRMLLLAPPPVLPHAYVGSSISADILTNEVVPRSSRRAESWPTRRATPAHGAASVPEPAQWHGLAAPPLRAIAAPSSTAMGCTPRRLAPPPSRSR